MKSLKWLRGCIAIAAVCLISWIQMVPAAFADQSQKAATPATETINNNFNYNEGLVESDTDFANATRGFIAAPNLSDLVIEPNSQEMQANGLKAWDLSQYDFLVNSEVTSSAPYLPEEGALPNAPGTVNPSLWRNAQLNMEYGLYEVVPGIYQIRGYDLSVMTLVAGETGWIIIDPLTSNETAVAAFQLVADNKAKMAAGNGSDYGPYEFTFEGNPISAVMYTHSHVDHFSGVRALEEINESDIPVIIAPEGFLEEAVSENVFAGNVMSRRATYMYGNLISKGLQGQVDGGLGKTTSAGEITVIPPNVIVGSDSFEFIVPKPRLVSEISDKDKKIPALSVDGRTVQFQNVPGSEAPAEMMFYFDDFDALCASEDATHTMHNLYTLRGAKVRDALGWAKYLNQTIDLFKDNVQVVFASHHWPTWDEKETPENDVVVYLKKQRDLYKYIHDQTLHYANQGYTMLEIAEMLQLPASLSSEWYNRGYYGSLNHDVKAVYQRYLGWFDGNPAHLYSLPPENAGRKYIDYMGGPSVAIQKAEADFKRAAVTAQKLPSEDYRWVAQVMSDVVFGYCKDTPPPYLTKIYNRDIEACRKATQLEADALEQLGYQAESGPWRNFFLGGAKELRDGVATVATPDTASPDIIRSMTSDLLFDYMAIALNGEAAADNGPYVFHLIFSDPATATAAENDEQYLLSVENGVLNYTDKIGNAPVDGTLEILRSTLNEVILGDKAIGSCPADAPDGCVPLTEGTDYTYDGKNGEFGNFLSLLEPFEFWFNVVLP